MKAYRIVGRSGGLLLTTMFSTRDRAEQELRDDELGEGDGYFIEECEPRRQVRWMDTDRQIELRFGRAAPKVGSCRRAKTCR